MLPSRRSLPQRLLRTVLLVCALVVPAAPAVAAGDEPTPQLHRSGRHLVDPYGRVVLVHGVNLVWKRDPYVPPDAAGGFTAADADLLRRYGFNGARIGTLWTGVTPERSGVADPTYLRRWQRVMDLLADRGMWMQLDFHQDQWHEIYGGEGVPDFVAARRPLPFGLLPPLTAPFPAGYYLPELSQVFDDFFAGRGPARASWVAAWRIVARHWRDQPYSMGYDLLNEPWAGTEGLTCLLTSCPETYRRELQPTYELALRAIRSVDPTGMVWFEPQHFAGGQQLDTFFTPVAGERNLGYAWHSYCPQVFLQSQGLPFADTAQCRSFSAERQAHAIEQAHDMRGAALMNEFGATDDVQAVRIDTEEAARAFMGWTYWAYKGWDDPTTADGSQGLFADDADLFTLKTEKLKALVQTYPQATAGTPLALSFDGVTGDFSYRYRPRTLRDAHGRVLPTVVFVSPLHYRGTPRVTVQGGRLLGSAADRRLRIAATGTAPVTVTVRSR